MSESIASASQPHERWRRRAMHSAAAAGARHFTHRAAPRPMLCTRFLFTVPTL